MNIKKRKINAEIPVPNKNKNGLLQTHEKILTVFLSSNVTDNSASDKCFATSTFDGFNYLGYYWVGINRVPNTQNIFSLSTNDSLTNAVWNPSDVLYISNDYQCLYVAGHKMRTWGCSKPYPCGACKMKSFNDQIKIRGLCGEETSEDDGGFDINYFPFGIKNHWPYLRYHNMIQRQIILINHNIL